MGLVMVERGSGDGRRINCLKMKQIIDVLGGTTCNDRQHLHVTALVDDAGDFRRETNRRTFQEPAGQTDCAGVEPISDLRLFGRDGRRPWISQCPTGLSDGWIDE